jgi:hypothetical protein
MSWFAKRQRDLGVSKARSKRAGISEAACENVVAKADVIKPVNS